jgi:hypothetical protein
MLFFLVVLIGAFLGMRFKVIVLIPAIGVVLAVAVLIGLVRGEHFVAMALQAAGAVTFLQTGYLCSIVIRFGIASARGWRALPAESAR